MIEDRFAYIVKYASKNWPEDYNQENGCYQIQCHDCGELFVGNKHRIWCKECDIPSKRFWERVAKKEPPRDNKCAHAGCWADGEMTGFARCMTKEVFPLREENERLKKLLQDTTAKQQQTEKSSEQAGE